MFIQYSTIFHVGWPPIHMLNGMSCFSHVSTCSFMIIMTLAVVDTMLVPWSTRMTFISPLFQL